MLDSREPGLQKMLDSGISCEPGLTGPARPPAQLNMSGVLPKMTLQVLISDFPVTWLWLLLMVVFFLQYALNFIKSNEIAANTFLDIQMWRL